MLWALVLDCFPHRELSRPKPFKHLAQHSGFTPAAPCPPLMCFQIEPGTIHRATVYR